MKLRLSDYISKYLVENGISHLFSVVGGGAMYLNDSFGHNENLKVIYHHHEQAAAIAAESFARVTNHPAAICVTSGPGGTNALTGCLCAFMGSIPMLVFSGQVRYELTSRISNFKYRTVGEQEFDIIRCVEGMTKYAEMIIDPKTIRYHLQKALFLATTGRPGPVWLDIPLDVQSAIIDTNDLVEFNSTEIIDQFPPPLDKAIFTEIIKKIKESKRPVLFLGLGVRLSGANENLRELISNLKIPVVTGMSTVDCLENDHQYYAGRAGITGDRAGNLAMQNSDLLLSIGSRISYKITGYDTSSWARHAYKIMCDIDAAELEKQHLKIDLPIWADAKDFILGLNHALIENSIIEKSEWLKNCKDWIKKYPVVNERHYQNTFENKINIYAFYNELSKLMKEGDLIVTTSGTSRVVGRQAFNIRKNQRFITNHATSPMGYCLPASIGACFAIKEKPVVLVTGEGGFQMNIQELQTIKQHKLPIKIIVLNNEGYHSIRITQKSFFPNNSHIGIGDESQDLSFPDLSKISYAYGLKYFKCNNISELNIKLLELLNLSESAIFEVFISKNQSVEPKVTSKKLSNGKFISSPLEDMSPFLPRDEFLLNMFIPPLDEI